MVNAFLLLLTCQLIGESLVRALRVPVPGPVIGMALLFGLLLWRGRDRRPGAGTEGQAGVSPALPDKLGAAADGLLQNLSLLFVPAAVGIIQHFGRVRDYALPIGAALIVSTVATLAVTALVFDRTRRLLGSSPSSDTEIE